MKKIEFLSIGIFLLLAGCSNNISDTAVFHSNPEHSGVYRAPQLNGLGKLNWKFKTGGRIFSSPTVVKDVVYIGSGDSNLYAVRVSTGNLLWKFKTGGEVSSSPLRYTIKPSISPVTMVIAMRWIEKPEVKNGNLKPEEKKKWKSPDLWTMQPADLYMEDLWDFFLSSPVVTVSRSEPLVYFGSSDGNLYALGRGQWRFAMEI